ncbi:methyl-accepting chemotaxis protein [Ectopseudomonas alcaliphila]|uniref:Methyl-accepting chemotaxis protein n=1 Tax=Ectopseudomonas alcaliphila TaxID=101564 RepID=A0ABU4Q283_9GAMM|nr:methyl-accepting chemotaxis protein [Pseudomonas alcaliphila]MDX5993933.1 methyl-accepting chemotaxis protein [Pseudomonas alcaliphila]
MGKKLLLGFGLVSLLAVSAIAQGLHATAFLLEQSQEVGERGKINQLVLQMHAAQKTYALEPEPAKLAEVQRLLQALATRLDELAGEPASRIGELSSTLRNALDGYRTQLGDFVASQRQAGEAQVLMQEQAEHARLQFEAVQMDMVDQVRGALDGGVLLDGDPLSLAEQASTLQRDLLVARSLEFAYVQTGMTTAQAGWRERVDGMDTALELLQGRVDPSSAESLAAASAALQAYRQAFERYLQSRDLSRQSAAHMEQQAQALMQPVEQAVSEGQARMQARGHAVMLGQLGGALVIVVLALAASLIIRGLIVAPLRNTLQLARRIAEGDLASVTPAHARQDELGQLLGAMQSMAATLRQLVVGMGEGVASLGRTSGALADLSTQSNAIAQRQRQETEQAATAMQEMAATVQHVAQNAAQASQAASQAQQRACTGAQVTEQSGLQVQHLAERMDQCVAAMDDLQQQVGCIGSVLEVISAIAEQTNLLALNAAIEAARAGEQGRGFAVVADEVRALARRTQTSTREIGELIEGLRQRSRHSQEQIRDCRSLSEQSAVLARQAGVALQDITAAVALSEQMNQQIAASAEQQSCVADEVSGNVGQIRQDAERVAQANQQTLVASQQLAMLEQQLRLAIAGLRT